VHLSSTAGCPQSHRDRGLDAAGRVVRVIHRGKRAEYRLQEIQRVRADVEQHAGAALAARLESRRCGHRPLEFVAFAVFERLQLAESPTLHQRAQARESGEVTADHADREHPLR
jgi:hypothetical protein